MIDDIVTEAVTAANRRREFDLGANAIRGGDEHGMIHLLERGGVEQAAEGADTRKNRFVRGGATDFSMSSPRGRQNQRPPRT